jgi:MYXO-CTERM domain-containing protein
MPGDRWNFAHGEELQVEDDPPSRRWPWALVAVALVLAVLWWLA